MYQRIIHNSIAVFMIINNSSYFPLYVTLDGYDDEMYEN